MEVFLEKLIIYTIVAGLILLTIFIYVRQLRRNPKKVEAFIRNAKNS